MPSKIDNYVCTRTLGSGGSAKVKLATNQANGEQVALKIFNMSLPSNTKKIMETIKKEVEVYTTLIHPYMVRLLDYKEEALWVKSSG